VKNLAATYQHIADILSYDSDASTLESTLSQPAFNWDVIVKEGSKHLVLPAIFCRLQSKQLLHVLPADLLSYLENITELNRNRNSSILNQMQSISDLLKQNHINHVFLKGAALLVSNIYEDPAERMIGDIDILIDLNQLDETFELFIKEGYNPIEQTFGNKFSEHKHLPRLTTEKYICAVELHRKLFVNHKDVALENANILKTKTNINQFYIPNEQHLLRHNILNYQINDKGQLYNSLNFRSSFDTITLLKKRTLHLNFEENNTIKNYFRVLSIFFKEIRPDTTIKYNIKSSFYLFKLKNLKFYRFWNALLRITNYLLSLTNRIPLFLYNKAYRKEFLADRKRIYQHFVTILKGS